MKYGRCSEWNRRFKKMEWKVVFHTNYIPAYKTYNKLLSNALDIAYQYEYVVSMVISVYTYIANAK